MKNTIYILLGLTSTLAVSNRFLHVTDIHIDTSYHTGSPTHCVLGSTGLGCCRKYDIPLMGSPKARRWGEKTCDAPLLLVNETFRWISQHFTNLDFVLYGGDTVGHHDLSQSESKNLETLGLMSDMFNHHFSTIPVIPNQGNHDTYPIDQTLPGVTGRMREQLSEYWSPRLGVEASSKFATQCYFTYSIS